jgi:hypothetical protein
MYHSRHDPFRPPDWRWRRALWLAEEGKCSRKEPEDPRVLLARRFVVLWGGAASEEKKAALADRFPGVFYARELHARGQEDDRWVVEARVLADQPAEEIALRQNTTAEVISWYEALFFDVREQLHRRDWVANRVLGPAFRRGVRARDFDLLLKLYALQGGPVVVDFLVEGGARAKSRPASLEEVPDFFARDKRHSLARLAAGAARCLPVTPEQQAAVLDAHHRLEELESQAGAGGKRGDLADNIAGVLEGLAFSKAPSPAGGGGGGRVELRAAEMVYKACGGAPAPQAPEELLNFKIPEAPPGRREREE